MLWGVFNHSPTPYPIVIFWFRLFLSLFFIPFSLTAATLTWDGDLNAGGLQDGSGIWNTLATDRWFNAAPGPEAYQAWSNANPDTAIFGNGNGTAGTVTLTEAIIAAGLTFNAAGSGTYTLTGSTLTLAGTPVVTANVDAAISSVLAGNADMSKTGTGVLTLSGSTANTLNGTTTISGGTLTLAKSAGVNAIAGNIQVNSGGTLLWGGNHNQIADTAAITVAGGSIQFNSRNETFASYTQTSGGQTGNNAGIVSITGTFAMSGGTVLTINSNGQWSANSADFTGYSTIGNALLLGGDGAVAVTSFSVGAGGLTLNGQTLMLNRTTTVGRLGNQLVLNGNVTASGTNTIGTSGSAALPTGAVNQLNLGSSTRSWNITAGTTSVSLPLVGTGGLTKIGNGILAITGGVANTNTGLMSATAGTLSLGKTAGIAAFGGDVLVNGGTLLWVTSDQIPDGATITVSSGPTLNFSGRNETFANYVQTGGTGISASSANSGIVNIVGTATLSGGGSMTVNSGGRMTVNALNATGFSGIVLNVGGNSAARISSFTQGSGGMTLTGQTITLNKGTSDGNLGSEIILNGPITATGTNNINLSSGTFGVAQINLGTEVRTWAINGGLTTSNVPLIGTGGVLKTGAGTLRLTTPSTYTGKTTVSAGTLSLTATGSIAESGWIQLDSGSTFDVSAVAGGFAYAPASGTPVISGSGSVTGGLNIGGVAQIRPGSSSIAADAGTAGDGIGTLAISGSLSLAPAAPSTVAQLQILDGSTADKITIGGDLTLTANSFLSVVMDEDYVPVSGHTWTLLDWVGLIQSTGFLLGDNNRTGNNSLGNEGNLDLPDVSAWGLLWNVGPMANGGALTITLVPEPSRLLFLILGLAILCLKRPRRQRQPLI